MDEFEYSCKSDDGTKVKIAFSEESDVTWNDLLDKFVIFLKAVGYSPGKLEDVIDDDILLT